MRAFLLALLLAFVSVAVSAATVTTKFTLNNSGWTDLGAGPLLLSFNGIGGVYAISDTTPALTADGFAKDRGGSIRVNTTSHVWGKAKDVFGVTAYVTGSGGGGPTSVWSAADAAANGMTLSNGGLTVTQAGSSGWQTIRNSVSKTSGKVYVEFLGSVVVGPTNLFGLANAGFASSNYLGASNYSVGLYNAGNQASGFTLNYAIPQVPAVNDVWALAVDFAAGKVWIAQNNVWLGSSNPATGSLPVASFTPATVGALFAGMSFFGGPFTYTLQPTAASQKYAPPAGFTPWN